MPSINGYNVHKSAMIFLLDERVRMVVASYGEKPGTPNDRQLFKTFDDTIKKDDIIIIETDTRHGMTCAKVLKVLDEPEILEGREVKWIVGKVDPTTYEQLVEKENQLIRVAELAKKRKAMRELKDDLTGGTTVDELLRLAHGAPKDVTDQPAPAVGPAGPKTE